MPWLLDHLKAGSDLAAMEQDAWQRGYANVRGWTKRKPLVVQIATTVAGCGFGLALGSTWWERALFAASLAVAAFLLGLLVLWLWHSAAALAQQRNEAREYARALEAHSREYAEWARRREIAEDFRRETFEHVKIILNGDDPRSASELETHWRTTVRSVTAQLREYGAADDFLAEIAASLTGLDSKDDSYGDDEIGRIRNNMLTVCQNAWSANRSMDRPPNTPSPPASMN